MTREELMAHTRAEIEKHFDDILVLIGIAWNEGVRNERLRAERSVRVARWVPEPNRRNHWRCSSCGNVWGVPAMAMHYCPDCGAEMEETKDE